MPSISWSLASTLDRTSKTAPFSFIPNVVALALLDQSSLLFVLIFRRLES